MSGRKLRWLTVGLFASAGAGLLTLTSMMNSAFAYGETADVAAADPVGLVMGGSGLPIPGPDYVAAANGLYIDNPFHPNFPGTFYPPPYSNGLFTPEGLYPLTGVHTLLFNYPTDPTTGFPDLSSSVGQGMPILENAIASNAFYGFPSTVFGYSQSATISSLVMQQLDPTGTPQPDAGLQFLLIGDPSAPNGGLLERFAGAELLNGQILPNQLTLPSLGISFDGATPADSFPTDIYSIEYDGFTDFPRYPINFLADLNAFLGISDLHGTYLNQGLGLAGGPTAEQIANAILLPGSAASGTADSLTNYYMIPTTDLPLLDPIRGIPVVGNPIADLLQPDLRVLVNLGYGPDNLGYSLPANVPTPFGLFPTVDPTTLSNELAAGAQQGISAFEADLSNPAALMSSLSLPSLSAVAAAPAALPSFTDVVNTLSSAASTAYGTLLPTADIINALTTSVPAFEATLFTGSLQAGDLLDAIGLPIAAETGVLTLAGGFEYSVITDAISQISADLMSLF